jgi:hypothetical protein
MRKSNQRVNNNENLHQAVKSPKEVFCFRGTIPFLVFSNREVIKTETFERKEQKHGTSIPPFYRRR